MKFILAILILVSTNLYAQDFFQRTYGGTGSEFGRGVVQTGDGGYACVGATNSYADGSSNVYLIKLDELGNYVWGRNIGGIGTIEWGMDIIEDSEGNLVIAGYTNNTENSDYDGLIIKLSGAGEIIWQKKFGSDDWDFFESLDLDSEDAIYAVGNSFRDGSQQGWIVKVNQNGDEIWEETLTGSGKIYLTGVSVCDDENISYVGYSENLISSSNSFLSGIISENSTLKWVRTEDEWGNIIVNDCECHNNVIYSIGTVFSEDASNFYLAKQEVEFGNSLLNSPLLDSPLSFYAESIDITPSGNLVLAGAGEFIFFEGLDAFIIKRNDDGNYISSDFNDTFGQPGYDYFYDVSVTTDGGYIAVGTTNSFENSEQLYLAKIASDGQVSSTNEDFLDLATPTRNKNPEQGISLYPNPTLNRTKIETSRKIESLLLSNSNGQILWQKMNITTNPESLDLSGFVSGIYILRIESSDGSVSHHKVIKSQ